MTRFAVFIATAGYCGYFPVAPGTAGSAAGLLVYVLVSWAGTPLVEVAAIALVFAAGAWSATHAERFFGGIDPGPVVIDEVLGMLITLAFIPAGWLAMLAGFFLFRVLDVIKPFPADRLEKFHGGFGIMADDAMAGVYANLALRGLMWLAPNWFR